ncbi:bifunctional CRAL-TRIO lipid binding domain superfamily/CRAL-TRIO lipid binding domain/CRAL-TRIO [Babesia duncani]|uniref:Bifunctional CRAL-TRIO lipid binding domain superfamily/CRAL-TRIO lipid binding domain/CRAL-TRIO n=1 Tax=Babesia duncani TaxID=323732 RepID=A0AAD9PIJ7_9APIC|nr:bifunctional CRAL-TRIO lipid binding domain superfamily/CRAL-TRIO lipid binding domain/CRAL-TRIO [Babesia duncani]
MAIVGSANSKSLKNAPTSLTEVELQGLVQALTPEQVILLQQIKAAFAPQILGKESRYNDLFFVRFLRARSFDIKKTTVMLEKYFAWRQEQQVDLIVETDMSSIRDTVRLYYPHGYHGIDKLGRPIYLERLGRASISKLLENVTTEQLTKYYIQRYEYLVHVAMPAASMQTGKCVEQLLTIVDLKGFSISQLNHRLKALLSAISSVSQNYYPELLGKLLFINSSAIFSALYSLLSSLVDAKTIAKVAVINSKTESRRRILEMVDVDQLPEFLGGTCPDDTWQESNLGPWGDGYILDKLRATNDHVPDYLYSIRNF